jgi:uncharacterized membrane protein YjjP (DUF1212 family)
LQIRAVPARGRALAVAIAAAGLALVLARVLPGNWFVIVATLVAATLGYALERWTSAPKS